MSTYKVTVTLEHPARETVQVRREGPADHTDQAVSNTLLEALREVQDRLGVMDTLSELVASRGVLSGLASMLDSFGMPPSKHYDGMAAVIDRVAGLGHEVRSLRAGGPSDDVRYRELHQRITELTGERDSAHAMISAYGEVINGVRRALEVRPDTPDADLPSLVQAYKYADGELKNAVSMISAQRDRLQEDLRRTEQKLDAALGDLRSNREALESISEEFEAAGYGPAPSTFEGLRAKVRELGADANRWNDLTADVLARALHVAQDANGSVTGHPFTRVEWEAQSDAARAHQIRTAGDALRELGRVLPFAYATPEMLARALHEVEVREAAKPEGSRISVITADGVDRPQDRQQLMDELMPWDPASKPYQADLVDKVRRAMENLRVVPSVSLLPVTAAELGRAMYESGPHRTPWEQVAENYTEHAQRVLDMLPSFAAPKTGDWSNMARTARKTGLSPLHPTVLAEFLVSSIVDQRVADGGKVGDVLPVYGWDDMLGIAQGFWIGVAERVRVVVRAYQPDERVALDALEEIAGLVGMSFGASRDAEAIAMLTTEAVRQMVEGKRTPPPVPSQDVVRLREWLSQSREQASMYQGMLMATAEWLGLPPKSIDDAAAYGEAARAALAHDRRLQQDTLKTNRELWEQLKAFTPERLARAWFETPTSGAWVPVWDEHPGLHGGYVRHARAVLDRLSVAEPLKVTGAHVPGEFHVVTADGKVERGRMYLFTGALKGRPLARVDAVMAEALKRVSEPVDAAALLEQVRELGVEAQWLEKHNRRLRMRNKELRVELSAAMGIEGLSNVELVRRGRALFNVESEFEQFRRQLSSTMLTGSTQTQVLLRAATELAGFERLHKMCKGAAALERELTEQLAEVAGLSPESGWTWQPLLARVQADLAAGKRSAQVMADRHRDLSEALGLSGESWEDMITTVTGRASRAEVLRSESNALDEIRRTLDLHPKLFPSAVVDEVATVKAARNLAQGQLFRLFQAFGVQHETLSRQDIEAATDKALSIAGEAVRCQRLMVELRHILGLDADTDASVVVSTVRRRSGELAEVLGLPELSSWEWEPLLRQVHKVRRSAVMVSDDAQDAGRMRDAVLTLLEAAGIDERLAVDAVMQKADVAAAILRTWLDVARAVEQMDGQDFGELRDRPDEVAPVLEHHVSRRAEFDRYVSVVNELEALLATLTGGPVRPHAASLRDRFGLLIDTIFEPVLELGSRFEVKFEEHGSKQEHARAVLAAVRKFEDELRDAVAEFDIGEPTLAEIPGIVAGYAKTYHSAGRYQAVLHNIEIALSQWTGNLKTFDDATLKQRLADLVEQLGGDRAPKTIKVLQQNQFWTQGPNTLDSDPAKRWHIGCGGEVEWSADEAKDVCRDCGQACVPERSAPVITVTEVPSPFVDGGLDLKAAAELVERDEDSKP